jgi:hypothetical protein
MSMKGKKLPRLGEHVQGVGRGFCQAIHRPVLMFDRRAMAHHFYLLLVTILNTVAGILTQLPV